MSDLESRITELEEKLAYQEDTLHKLDDALISQQRQLLETERKINLLMDQLQKLESSLPEPPQDEKPPHY